MRERFDCESCAVRDRGLCSAVSEAAAVEIRRIAHHKRALSRQVIFGGDQPPAWLAIVVSGVIKLVKTQKDGRQQIVGLRFPGDLIGRPYAENHPLIAEATTKLEFCCFTKATFEELMQKHPSVEAALLKRTLDDLDASREWMFVLGRKTAREKLASLLASISLRFLGSAPRAEGDDAPLRFDLPLSRNEIADFLGLTTETVSRELRALRAMGLIATRGWRHLEVLKLAALGALADGESLSPV
jgi:CRP/FNR family transcriptional regulator